MSIGARISGVGAFIPPRTVSNHDLAKMMDTSDEWIQQRTGIVNRHWVEDDVHTSDLALEAAKVALDDAGISKDDLDMIILATLSPDHDFPGTACFLQSKLDCPGIPAFDIRQQCSGFIYGLSMAQNFIQGGQYKNILLVGTEIHSKGLDRTPNGRDVSVLFGDGAGAVVISSSDVKDDSKDGHILGCNLHADGKYAKELWIPAPGNAFDESARLSHAMLDEGLHYPQMNGKVVFVHAVRNMAETLVNTLKENKTQLDSIDLFLFHQANLRINQKVGEVMGIPDEKIFNTIQEYGNTTAATIPIGMFDAIKAGKLKRGDLVAMAAFGSGFTWASALLRY